MGLLTLAGLLGVLGALTIRDDGKRAYSDWVNTDPYKGYKEGGNDVCAIAVKTRMKTIAKMADDIFKEEYGRFKAENPDIKCLCDLDTTQFVPLAIACEERLAKDLQKEFGVPARWHYPIITKDEEPPAWVECLLRKGAEQQINHGYHPFEYYGRRGICSLPDECRDGEVRYSIFPQIYSFTGYGGLFLTTETVYDGNSLYWKTKDKLFSLARRDKIILSQEEKFESYRRHMRYVIGYKHLFNLYDDDLSTLTEDELIELLESMGDNFNEMEIFL